MKEIQKILKQVVYCTIAFVSLALSAQTTTENYIVKKVYKTKRTTVSSLTTVPTDSMTKVVSYFDGLGRIKQNVAVKAGANLAANNNLAYDWTLNNTGSTGFYNKEGLDSENTIVNGTTPFGDTDLLWECKGVQDNGGAQGDGGWATDYFAIDKTKTYRYTVWVKRTGSQDGTTYYGPNNIENIDGSANGNPYFWYGDLPQLDTWYLLVGIVHPSGYTGGDIGVSGVYDINGTKVIDAAEFRWRSTSTTGSFRNYLFYATNPVVRQYFWSPLVQQIDGNEMPLNQVLTTASVVTPEIEAKDIVTHYTYDALGRQTKDYLPYADNSNNGDFRTGDIGLATQAYYKNKYPDDFLNTITGNVNAYSEKTIEESPFNRVLEQSAPGKDWALTNTNVVNKGYTDGHTIKFDYEVNTTTDAVKQYSVSFANNTYEPSLTGVTTNYAVGTLSKTVTKDENWTVGDGLNHTTEEFKNKKGQVVLKRTYNNSTAHDTYYVYDDFGNLTYVLPPKANDLTIDTTVLNDLCYQYKYDYRNRLVEKKIPGKGWEYIVYDKLDRPVLTQDSIQRVKSPKKEWLFTKYDVLGRVVYTGLRKDNSSRVDMQGYANNGSYLQYESRTPSAQTYAGTTIYYTTTAIPAGIDNIYTINYYDTYVDLPTGFTAPTTIYGQTVTTNTKGLATVSKVRVLTTNHWITTITYYDEKARPIYVYTKNDYLGTTDIVESKLDFTGKVLETKTTHKKTGKTDIVTIERFEYDHADRLIAQTQKVNNQVSTRLVRNHYDELGQLKSKLVGSGTKKGYADVTSGISISNDVITKTGSNNVWNEGLATLGSFQADGYLEFSPVYNNHFLMAGLSYTNANASYCSISFAIHLRNNEINVYEFCGNVGTNFGTYNAGDVFRVERIGTKVYYKKNGKTFYISALTSTGTLLGDISLYHTNTQIKNLHIVDNSKGLQKVDYNYNVRGWLANINQDAYNDNDLFNFGLKYNNPTTGTPLFNGNISQTSWSSLNTDSSTKTYTYSYDALNRITGADDNTGNYNLNFVSYDKNGNITILKRKGHINSGATSFGMMDDLDYDYTGNKLTKVTDSGNNTYGFKDGANTSTEYTYDNNGNMISDANKGITSITYNHLNLPKVVTINGNTITYTYDATGAKLRKVVSGTTTDYAGNYIYENNTLQFFNHVEGYTKNNSGTFSNVYQYRDHLGNIRLSYTDANNDGVITASTEIIEESNYYPFGLKHKGYNNVVTSGGNSVAQKYGYTGKEHQDELGLGWIDITARNYDAALGRWMNLDPLAEQMRRHSPYNYAFNSPIYFIDPDGMAPRGNPILKLLKRLAKKGIKYTGRTSKGRIKPISRKHAEKLLAEKQSVILTGKGKSKEAKKLFKSANPGKKTVRHGKHNVKKKSGAFDNVNTAHHQKSSGDGSHAFYDSGKTIVATTAASAVAESANASNGSIETSNITSSSSSNSSITGSPTLDKIAKLSYKFVSFFDNLGNKIFGKNTDAAKVTNELNPLNLGVSDMLKTVYEKND